MITAFLSLQFANNKSKSKVSQNSASSALQKLKYFTWDLEGNLHTLCPFSFNGNFAIEAGEYCTFSAEYRVNLIAAMVQALQNYWHLLYTKNGERRISWTTSFGRSPYKSMQLCETQCHRQWGWLNKDSSHEGHNRFSLVNRSESPATRQSTCGSANVVQEGEEN